MTRLVRLGVLVFGTVVGLVLGEIVLRVAWTNPWIHANRVIPLREQLPNQNSTLTLDPRLFPYGVTTMRTDEDGFILPGLVPGPSPAITVAFLGGSTTECALLPEDSRWPYLVAKKLAAQKHRAVRVLQAGTAGSNTHNLLNVLLNKVVKYSPDVIVLMESVNDAGFLAEKGSYDGAMVAESTPGLGDLLSRNIHTIGLMRQLQARRLVNKEANDNARQLVLEKDTFALWHLDRLRLLGASESQYVVRLRLFVDMSRSLGAVPVLMTQPYYQLGQAGLSAAERRTWLGGLEFMDRFSGHVREVAGQKRSPLIDLARGLEPRREYFWDNIHYTVRGAESVADIVALHLADVIPVKQP